MAAEGLAYYQALADEFRQNITAKLDQYQLGDDL